MASPRSRKNDAKLQAFEGWLAQGCNPEEAARRAGYKGSSLASNAKKRAQLSSVKTNVARIRQEAAKSTIVTVERLIDNAEEARLLAMTLEEPSAANQCIQTMAKLSGLWRDKVAMTDPSGEKPAEIIVTDADRVRALADLVARAARE